MIQIRMDSGMINKRFRGWDAWGNEVDSDIKMEVK